MNLCVFVCCSATEPISSVQGNWNMVTVLRIVKETFCWSADPFFVVQTLFAYWKICINCHNPVLKIHFCESLKLFLLDIFWFFDKWKWWRQRKWWREMSYISLCLTIFVKQPHCNTNTNTLLVFLRWWGHYVGFLKWFKKTRLRYEKVNGQVIWTGFHVCDYFLYI